MYLVMVAWHAHDGRLGILVAGATILVATHHGILLGGRD